MSVQVLTAAAARASRTSPSSVITPGLLLAGSLENKQCMEKVPKCLHRCRGSQCSASDTLCTCSVLRAEQNRTVTRFADIGAPSEGP